MKNVIPINPEARQIRDAMLHPDTTQISVCSLPKMPQGFWTLLIEYSRTWVYSDVNIPHARMLITSKKGRGFVNLCTARGS